MGKNKQEIRLMKGNEAIGEAAVRAGVNCYFGYPITPQNELTAYMALRMEQEERTFIQAESEVSAINMVYGASSAGVRAMTSSSSPGISLKQEGISYMVGANLPGVIVNIMRGGPGLGNIAPAQSDYFQAVKGGGHGDYRLLVYAPSGVQEAADLTFKAFEKSDIYRNPVMILGDAVIGQMMEPVKFPDYVQDLPEKKWSVGYSNQERKRNIINSLSLKEGVVEEWNWLLKEKYDKIKKNEILFEQNNTEDADILMVAYGTSARICKSVLRNARNNGIKAGILRPITLWPFPYQQIRELSKKVKHIIVVEMSLGQLVEDVFMCTQNNVPIHLHARPGGGIPSEEDIYEIVENVSKGTDFSSITTRGTFLNYVPGGVL